MRHKRCSHPQQEANIHPDGKLLVFRCGSGGGRGAMEQHGHVVNILSPLTPLRMTHLNHTHRYTLWSRDILAEAAALEGACRAESLSYAVVWKCCEKIAVLEETMTVLVQRCAMGFATFTNRSRSGSGEGATHPPQACSAHTRRHWTSWTKGWGCFKRCGVLLWTKPRWPAGKIVSTAQNGAEFDAFSASSGGTMKEARRNGELGFA